MQIVHPFRLQDRSAATGSSGDHHSSVPEYEVIDLKGADDFECLLADRILALMSRLKKRRPHACSRGAFNVSPIDLMTGWTLSGHIGQSGVMKFLVALTDVSAHSCSARPA